MMGFRGASRYVSDDFQNAFILEVRAIKRAREWGLTNIIPMIPFCRSPEEGAKINKIMETEGLKRGEDGMKVYVMAEIPSNILCADLFCEHFDGFSIGSNDLTQLTYGVDRDGSKLIPLAKEYNYVTNSEAIRRSLHTLIEVAHERGKKVGICGQAPSDDPDFLRFLVQEGIDSISLNFDTFARGRINTWRTEIIEDKLADSEKKQSYKLLSECDKIIDSIRVPRGKLRNMVRKEGKEVNSKLASATEQFDEIFTELQNISYDFIKDINENSIVNFNDLFTQYNNKINQIGTSISDMKKKIRKFGVY
jgi:phosphoenolpyruvate-protein kinase (PTS system EI component)